MTKKDLIRIIREVVRKEVKAVLSENAKPVKKESMSLTEAVNETRNSKSDWPEISQQDIRNRFAGMQGQQTHTDINNRPVDVEALDPDLNKALTRDYSDLVKRFNK